MRKTLSVVVCGIALTASSFAAAPAAAPSPEVAISRRAERIYSVMSAVSVEDRKAVFRGLSPSMKAELWQAHFRAFNAAHALSPAQAAIMAAARDLFSEDLYAISTADPAWESQVHAPLQMLEQSARNVFPPELLQAAFGQVGPLEAEGSTAESSRPAPHLGRGMRPIADMPSSCTCSEASDWCFIGTCSGAICYFDTGCGFGWRYDCTAQCHRD
jgi:hypothetical protein